MTKKFPRFPQPQKPLETSEKPGNIDIWKLMSLFAETSYRILKKLFPETWKPGNLINTMFKIYVGV
jgi:hypothetical protein